MKTAKKTLALLVALLLLISVTPMTAMATLWSAGGEGNYTDADLDLSGFTEDELSAVPVSYVATHLTDNGNPITLDGDIAAYSLGYASDDFQLVNADSTMDLSGVNYITLLVGNPDQLDRDNQFIRVSLESTVESSDLEYYLIVSALDDKDETVDTDSLGFYYMLRTPPSSNEEQSVRIRLNLNSSYLTPEDNTLEDGTILHNSGTVKSDGAAVSVTAYLGAYESVEEIPKEAENITKQLFSDAGYLKTGDTSLSVTFCFNFDYTTTTEEGATTEESNTEVQPATINTYERSISISSTPYMYYENGAEWISEVINGYEYEYDEEGSYTYTRKLLIANDSPLNRDYRIHFYCYDWDYSTNKNIIKKAVVGQYSSLDEAADQKDIQDELLWADETENYFPWNFSTQGPLSITLFDVYGDMHQISTFDIKLAPPPEKSKDVYFRVYDAFDPVYSVSADTYIMSSEDDDFYNNGYQTLFILNYRDGSAIKGEELKPYFDSGKGTNIYVGFEDGSSELQESGASIVPVIYGKPLHYSAAAENGVDRSDYYVTFVTQVEGGALFVNGATNSEHIDDETGLPMRIVQLDDEHGYDHDIFFANFGDEELTGLKVTLANASGVELDDYWTIRSDSVGTHPPFDQGDPDNYGKLRLVAVDSEAFSIAGGKLTISADGVEPVTILLTGTVGRPKITTLVMKSGAVKYVPYSTFIQTNYIGEETDVIEFSVIKGELPEGVILRPNGEVYGVPMEAGTYTFTVEASYKDDSSYSDSKAYTIVVAENTDENVENATDEGYELIDRIPQVITPSEQLFHSEGALGEFIAVYLDGRKLVEGVDYILEEGSTKITLLEETFDGEEEGTHTIADEFRINGDEDGEMKRVAQNFTLEAKEEEGEEEGGNGSGNGSGNGQSGGDEETAPSVPIKPYELPDWIRNPNKDRQDDGSEPAQEKKFPFVDVPEYTWFYDDVKWVYDRELMLGVSDTLFDPDGTVDAATIVMVLARTIGVDLTQYADNTEINIPQDQWYSAALNWAIQSGLIDETFERNKPFSRGKMAVLLYKYFRYVGIDCRQPDPTVEFADADQMTPEQNEAYQVLYKYGIFKGVGNNRMDVNGNTSRAQLAALMHRLKLFIVSKIG